MTLDILGMSIILALYFTPFMLFTKDYFDNYQVLTKHITKTLLSPIWLKFTCSPIGLNKTGWDKHACGEEMFHEIYNLHHTLELWIYIITVCSKKVFLKYPVQQIALDEISSYMSLPCKSLKTSLFYIVLSTQIVLVHRRPRCSYEWQSAP